MSNSPFSYKFYSTTTAAWEGMYQGILSAKKSIYWEVYILMDDLAGMKFVDALCEKARSGVEVKVVLDSIGSMGFSKTSQERLRLSGAELLWFNTLLPGWSLRSWLTRIWRRNHRKLLIIDSRRAYLGGVNVEQVSADWCDLNVEIKGEVVAPLLRTFANTYLRSGGHLKNIRHLYTIKPKELLADLEHRVSFISHSPIYLSHRYFIRHLYRRAFKKARREVTFISPYYSPDKKFLKLVAKTCARGVRVNFIFPEHTDHAFLGYLNESFYNPTICAGAQVYLSKKMNHGKAMVVDEKFGLVGSFNLTPRSLDMNEESGVYFTDHAMVRDLKDIMDGWRAGARVLEDSCRIKPGFWRRLKLRLAKIFQDFV